MSLKAYTSGSTYPELKKDTLRIYNSRICPYAERTRLVLAYKNIPHEVVNIDLHDKPEWFLALAPVGKVPVIQKNDMLLNESTATSEYLDDVYPGDKLQESDPYKKAKDRILLENFGQITSSFYGLAFPLMKGVEIDNASDKAKEMLKRLQFFEDELTKRNSLFFGGDKPKMIDMFLWPHFERIPVITAFVPELKLTKDKFPKIVSWQDAMTQIPAVKKEMFTPEQHVQMLKMRREGKSTSNFGLEE